MVGDRGEQGDVKGAAQWKGYSANEQWEGVPRKMPWVLYRWMDSYLIVDPIVVAATLLDGHTGFSIVQEAGVTFTALSTHFWALGRGTESPAAQGAGVCTDLIVAVRGALHCCKKKMQGGVRILLPFCPSLPVPYSSMSCNSRQNVSVLHGSTCPPAAWQALT